MLGAGPRDHSAQQEGECPYGAGDSGFRHSRSPSIITDALEALGVEVQVRLGMAESKPG